MKAKLIKIDFQYFLNDNDDNLIATTENSPYKRLSMKNCQAIERGYDLDELAENWVFETNGHKWSINDNTAGDNYGSYQTGFRKALSILGDKKFSDEDIHEAFMLGERGDRYGLHDILQSRQQTEWEVEIIKEIIDYGLDESCNPQYSKAPKHDENGCLILKLKSE
jgi:hypothetical protein